MESELIQLKLSGRLSYEDEITISQAAQIITFVNGSAGDASAASPAPGASLGSPAIEKEDDTPQRTVTNPRDALDISGAKTNPEKIVALAAYVLQDGELETFTLDTIKPLFRRAREATPGNFARDLDGAIRSGWIREADTQGELFLTAKAENVLETGFDAIRPKRGMSSKPRSNATRKSRNATKPEAFADVDNFPTSIDGIPPYHKIKLKRDKVLWALKSAKDLGVKGLLNKDIVWLTDHLGDGIPSNDINGHFRGLQKSGHANRSTVDNVIRITPDGEAYLQSLGQAGE